MAIELKMPALSPTMEKGTLARWLVKEGDAVKPGDLIAEIETGKATMGFEAIDEEVIASLVVPEGTDDVVVGTVIALIGEAREAAPAKVLETVKLSGMRKTIARRLTESKQTVPHFYLTARCNLDPLLKLRSELNASLASRNIKLSVNDLLIKAMALAMTDVPDANVQFGGDELHFGRVDISMAVAIAGGLVTQVIKDVGALSLSAIAQASKGLAAKARDGKLMPEESGRHRFHLQSRHVRHRRDVPGDKPASGTDFGRRRRCRTAVEGGWPNRARHYGCSHRQLRPLRHRRSRRHAVHDGAQGLWEEPTPSCIVNTFELKQRCNNRQTIKRPIVAQRDGYWDLALIVAYQPKG
jgi:hypothetical protein